MEQKAIQWVGSPSCLRGSYAFYKSVSCRAENGGPPQVWKLGEFYYARCGPQEPVCIAEVTLLWEDLSQRHLLASSRLYFLPEDTPKGRTREHGEDEVLAVSKKVVVRVDDLVKWACVEPAEWKKDPSGTNGLHKPRPNITICTPSTPENTSTSSTCTSSTLNSPPEPSAVSSGQDDSSEDQTEISVVVADCPSQPDSHCAADLQTAQPVSHCAADLQTAQPVSHCAADLQTAQPVSHSCVADLQTVSHCTADRPAEHAVSLCIAEHPVVASCGHMRSHAVIAADRPVAQTAVSHCVADRPAEHAVSLCVAALPVVKVLSYPQYCRFRSLQRRIQDGAAGDGGLQDPHLLALGAIRVALPSTRILFCRDTFSHPSLDNNTSLWAQIRCPPLSLRGRPRKRRGRYSRDSPTSSQSESWIERMKENVLGSVEMNNSEEDDWLPHPEEQLFLEQLYTYMDCHSSPIHKVPNLGFKRINLFLMYSVVKRLGGYDKVTSDRLWKVVYNELGGCPGSTSAATCTRRHYERLILPYEKHLEAGGAELQIPESLAVPRTRAVGRGRKPMAARGRKPRIKAREKSLTPPLPAAAAAPLSPPLPLPPPPPPPMVGMSPTAGPNHVGATSPDSPVVVVKRGRGRPPGRRNKATLLAQAKLLAQQHAQATKVLSPPQQHGQAKVVSLQVVSPQQKGLANKVVSPPQHGHKVVSPPQQHGHKVVSPPQHAQANKMVSLQVVSPPQQKGQANKVMSPQQQHAQTTKVVSPLQHGQANKVVSLHVVSPQQKGQATKVVSPQQQHGQTKVVSLQVVSPQPTATQTLLVFPPLLAGGRPQQQQQQQQQQHIKQLKVPQPQISVCPQTHVVYAGINLNSMPLTPELSPMSAPLLLPFQPKLGKEPQPQETTGDSLKQQQQQPPVSGGASPRHAASSGGSLGGGFSPTKGMCPLDVFRTRLGLHRPPPPPENPDALTPQSSTPRPPAPILHHHQQHHHPLQSKAGGGPVDTPLPGGDQHHHQCSGCSEDEASQQRGGNFREGKGRPPLPPLRVLPLDLDCSVHVRQLMRTRLGSTQLQSFTRRLSEVLSQDLKPAAPPAAPTPPVPSSPVTPPPEQAAPLNLSMRTPPLAGAAKRTCSDDDDDTDPRLSPSTDEPSAKKPRVCPSSEQAEAEDLSLGGRSNSASGRLGGGGGGGVAIKSQQEEPADLSSPVRLRAFLLGLPPFHIKVEEKDLSEAPSSWGKASLLLPHPVPLLLPPPSAATAAGSPRAEAKTTEVREDQNQATVKTEPCLPTAEAEPSLSAGCGGRDLGKTEAVPVRVETLKAEDVDVEREDGEDEMEAREEETSEPRDAMDQNGDFGEGREELPDDEKMECDVEALTNGLPSAVIPQPTALPLAQQS